MPNIPYFNSELVITPNKTIIHPHLLLSYVLPKNSLNLIMNNDYKKEKNKCIYWSRNQK